MTDEKQPDPPATDEAPPSDPDRGMGSVRQVLMAAGFTTLVIFGWSIRGKASTLQLLALVAGATVYFIWLAKWTRWNEPKG